MTNKEYMLSVMKEMGTKDALDLRERAKDMTGTEVIDEEKKIPNFNPQKDYTNCPVGTPVKDGEQVFKLIQPYNAANYPQTPVELPALWGLCHTANPAKAKPWATPYGTSGMYMKNEVYMEDDGQVYRSKVDNNVYRYTEYPRNWELVELE